VGLQLVRAPTGAGAHYEEARAVESGADFAQKVAIAAKEMRDAALGVGLVHRSGRIGADFSKVVREASELAAILAASAKTARSRAGPGTR